MKPKWVVEEVKPEENYILKIKFADGTKKAYDARELLEKPIYKELKNTAFFMKAYADGCSVAWNDDIDIAPEYLYEKGVEYSFE